MAPFDGPTHDERAELHSLREHLDTDAAQMYRDAIAACHAAANYISTAKLAAVGRASKEDLNNALWLMVGALERVGLQV